LQQLLLLVVVVVVTTPVTGMVAVLVVAVLTVTEELQYTQGVQVHPIKASLVVVVTTAMRELRMLPALVVVLLLWVVVLLPVIQMLPVSVALGCHRLLLVAQ